MPQAIGLIYPNPIGHDHYRYTPLLALWRDMALPRSKGKRLARGHSCWMKRQAMVAHCRLLLTCGDTARHDQFLLSDRANPAYPLRSSPSEIRLRLC